MIMERTSQSLKGEMSRLAIEFKPGVFISNINARVRDKIWEKIVNVWLLDAIMIYTTNNEQGYSVRMNKNPSRNVINNEGIFLSEHTIEKK
jgi:CRISPR-associated protein Cas2